MDQKFIFYISGSPKQVWEAILLPDGIFKKMYGAVIKSTFKTGQRLEFIGPGPDGPETVQIYGRVLKHERYKVLSYTDHPGPSYYPNHAELESRVSFTLEPVGKTTKLTLVEDQSSAGEGEEDQSWLWWLILSNLKTLVETGKPLDFS